MITNNELLAIRDACHPIKDRALLQVTEDLSELRSKVQHVLDYDTSKTIHSYTGEHPTYDDKKFREQVRLMRDETESELKALFQRTLNAVAPTHTFWIQFNPKLVQEIRDAGFTVRERVDEEEDD